MTEIINSLGESIVVLMRMINIAARKWAMGETPLKTRPTTKFDHELAGIKVAMKAMGIDFEFDYDEDVIEFTAATIMGRRFDVK